MADESKRKSFWSVRELAEYLNVEYKTLYRQVVAGNLPAVKIGGVFRVRQEDVDAFLENMRVPTKKKPGSLVDAFREDIYGSLYPERLEQTVEGLACARCGRLIKSIHLIGGACQHPSCEAILCSQCHANEDDRYCLEHRVPVSEKLGQARQHLSTERIDVLVTAEEARERELNFVSRFDQKIRELKRIVNPTDGSIQVVRSWDDIHREEAEFDSMAPSLLGVPHQIAEVKAFPRNISSSYHLGRQRNSNQGSSIFVIKATCVSRVREHLQNGFDTRPLSHPELVWLLEHGIERARASDAPHILGIGSPTGWDDQAQQTICGNGDQRVFSSLYIAVCLVDLNANRVFYNPVDNRIKPFIGLYRGDLDGEAVNRVKDFLQSKLVERASQGIAEAMEATGQRRDIVVEAFSQLGAEEGYSVIRVDGHVVISREV